MILRMPCAIAAGLLALLAGPSLAHAGGDYPAGWVNVGYLQGFVWSRHDFAFAYGAEASYSAWLDRHSALGAFVQAQSYELEHGRYAAGVQANLPALGSGGTPILGFELGYAQRERAEGYARTHGVHLAPFVSMGLVHLATRATIAVAPSRGGHGHEFAVVLALKLPIPIHGDLDLLGPHPFGGS